MKTALSAIGLLAALMFPLAASAGSKITIVSQDDPGVGFNDPTPATPVGGNPGTTVGEQRTIAFERAAEIWGETLDSSVEIRIEASFAPLECSSNEGVLGSAGPIAIEADHPGVPIPNTWYHIALANRQAGEDRDPSGNDIGARFNGDLGKPGCLSGSSWYYGLDSNAPDGGIDLVVVLLHEFAHGLGFSEFINSDNGSFFQSIPDAYSRNLFDNNMQLAYVDMTNTQRRSSLTSRNVVWTGESSIEAAPGRLNRVDPPVVRIESPGSISGDYTAGRANFGPRALPAFSGKMVNARDAANGSGPSASDGCTELTNPAEIKGNIALIDRGDCDYVVKVKNAQDAGAIGVVILNNRQESAPPAMGGKDVTITIPTLSLSQADGNTIRAQVPSGVTGTGTEIEDSPMVGADTAGRPAVYAPSPFEPGSSTSHWDTSATPNLLMEPAINVDLVHVVDLTLTAFHDMGWFAVAGMEVVMGSRVTGDTVPPPMPGDTIRYEIDILQVSGSAATNVGAKATLDPNVTLVSGSAETSVGTVDVGNENGDETVEITVGGLSPGASATLKFDVMVNEDVEKEVEEVTSSVVVSGTNFESIEKSASTEIDVSFNPMSATKTATLMLDADESGSITPGDTVRYQIDLRNDGAVEFLTVVVTDDLDDNLSTAQIVGVSSGDVTSGSTAGEKKVVWEVPSVAAGGTQTLVFDVFVAEELPTRVTHILNQASVTGIGFESTVTDNPGTEAPLDATSFGIKQPRRRATRR